MASTYSTNLKIELQSTGENSGTWGTITNTNLGTALEQAIVGYGNPSFASDADLTLSYTDTNAAQTARALVLNVTSAVSLTGTRELVVPTIQKQYIVQNNTTGSQSITVKTSGGTGITVPNGRKAHLYVDGTNVIQMFDFVDINGGAIDGTTVGASSASTGAFTTLTASGATTLNGAVALGDAAADLITVPGTVNSNVIFTDNTFDIGASGATRPRTGYFGTSVLSPLVTATNVQVTNVKANDGTVAVTIADSTGAVGVSTAFTLSTATGNIALGTSQTSGTFTVGGASQTGNITLDQSTKAHTLAIGTGATENGATKTINIGTNGVSGSTTTITIGSSNGTTTTFNGTVNATTVNVTTLDLTNLEVTNIKAKDGTASITLADGTGNVSIAPNVTLGDASTDTVQVNGYMGVGQAGSATSGIIVGSTALTGTTQRGVYSAPTFSTGATANGLAFQAAPATAASAFTVSDLVGFYASNATKGAGSTITNQHGVYINDQSQGTNNYGVTSVVSSGTNKWNIYASGTARNHMAGALSVGATTDPGTGGLYVAGNTTLGDATTDTVQVNGYGAVGTPNNAIMWRLTGSGGFAGTTQIGFSASQTGTSAGTTALIGYSSGLTTATASYTIANVYNFSAADVTKGAGSTITNQHGLYIADQTQGTNNYGITSLVSSGTNKWNIYASGTANNAFAGNVRIGSTTAPTNALDVTGAMTVSGNATLGDASTDTVQVNGYMGVGGAGAANKGIYQRNTALTGASQYGITAEGTFSSAATGGSGFAASFATEAAAFTLTDAIGFRMFNTSKGAGSTITNQHGFYVADLTNGTNNYGITSLVSSGTNKWNIYASGTAANYFAGQIGLATTPSAWGSSNVIEILNGGSWGYVNGGNHMTTNTYFNGTNWIYKTSALAANYYQNTSGQHIFRNAASGTAGATATFNERFAINQSEAVFNDPGNDYDFRVESDTNTHALFVQGSDGFVGVGTSAPLYLLDVRNASGAATINVQASTGAAAFRAISLASGTAQLQLISAPGTQSIVGGVGSVNNMVFNVDSTERFRLATAEAVFNDTGADYDFRVESDTNPHALFVEGTNSNVKVGGSAERATTVGTNHLDIFDGTAPVGTLANGISLYSSSGEAYVMDAAGNATLFSPHDAETNEWIFKSKHTPSGKVLKIDVEKMLRFINDHFGLDAIHEFTEE